MARSIYLGAFVLCSMALGVQASDNTKLIESVLKTHAEAIARAGEQRAKAVEKASNDAVSQLTRLASKAYSEKDRLAETSAWKAVLRLDRSHSKAIQYFKDLGTLDQVLTEIPEPADEKKPKTAIVGKWNFYRDGSTNSSFATFDFQSDGSIFQASNGEGFKHWGKLTRDGEAYVCRDGNGEANYVFRYTIFGDRLVAEQFSASAYPKSAPSWFYYAMRSPE